MASTRIYDLQMTYGEKECKADPYLAKLREVIRQISADKIASEGEERGQSYYIRKGWRICIWKKWQHFCTERTGQKTERKS